MTQIVSNSQTPDQEIPISESLIKELLENIQVGLRSIRLLGEGWDNVMYLINESYLVRLPRRAVADQLIQNEQMFLSKYGKDLPIPVPEVLHFGKPGSTYPFHWSISNYLLGETATVEKPSSDQAERFASFLKTLHGFNTEGISINPYRSTPLSNRKQDIAAKLDQLEEKTQLINQGIRQIWTDALECQVPEKKVVIHGDLHARNILLFQSRFSGIIDWGDVCQGDPATDLASIWMLFKKKEDRDGILDMYGADEELRIRAKGWAVLFGVLLLSIGIANNDTHQLIGEFTLKNLQVH